MKKILIFLGALLTTLPVGAQAFTITPLRYSITIDPGSSQALTVSVRNTDPTPVTFEATAIPLGQDAAGKPVFSPETQEVAASWVAPAAQTIVVPPKTVKDVVFTVTVPENTPAGTHFLGLLITPTSTTSSPMQANVNAATLVLLTVGGSVQESAFIDEWKPEQTMSAKGAWPATLRIKNTGTVAVPLSGVVQIKNGNGEVIKEEVLQLGNTLLVDSYRQITHTITLPAGANSGRYSATAIVRYGVVGQSAEASATLWFLPPFTLWVTAGAVLVILGVMGYVLRTRKKKSL